MATFTPIPSKRADVSFLRRIEEADRAQIRKYLREEIGVSARTSQRYVANAFSEQVRNPPKEIAEAIYQKWLEIELQKRDPFLETRSDISAAYPKLGRNILAEWKADPEPDCGGRGILGVESHEAGELTDLDAAFAQFNDLVDNAREAGSDDGNGGTVSIEMYYLTPGKYERATWGNSGRMKGAKKEVDEFREPVFVITINVMICGSDRQ